MSDRTPAAFLTSLGLHGLVVGLFLFAAYSANDPGKPATKIFELVAGEGDNFAATDAPALGSPTGIKLTLPTPPAPKPEPVALEVVKPEPAPEPAPVEPPKPEPKPKTVPVPEAAKKTPDATTPTKSTTTKTKTLADQMRWEAIKAESKIKQQVARDKAAEQKRLEKERLEQARLAAAAAKAPQVDAKGIATGVLGGSTANTVGGAGGKALTRSDGPVLEAYFGMLRERLFKALEKPPGLSDALVAEAEFRLNADGSITGVRIITRSGSAEFDRAVLDAYARVRMPPRPDGKSSVQTARFLAKDLDRG
jgi:TonB family protein